MWSEMGKQNLQAKNVYSLNIYTLNVKSDEFFVWPNFN